MKNREEFEPSHQLTLIKEGNELLPKQIPPEPW